MKIKVIGGGLAGVESAYLLANKGYKVELYEMRPSKMTDAHKTHLLAELVCSNSFRSNDTLNAVGLLKNEMEEFNSLILEAAHKHKVPAGSSLSVDRILFSKYVDDKIRNHPNIKVIEEEVTKINDDEITVIAAGPLVSSALSTEIQNKIGAKDLHFFDAVAPIIEFSSINMNICYYKSRYDKGTADYINCPMTKEEYDIFHNELINAKGVIKKDFEKDVFEACMPVEVMAKRGFETLFFGPLKPVGLEKEDGSRPYAVIQLRQDDAAKTMYNIVGFQTNLTWGEQKRIINLIPGLENANIVRYGVMHKNTYLESPNLLNSSFQVINKPNLFFAGQISGVEGYVESAASGINVGIQVDMYLKKVKMIPFPKNTMMGALSNYISTPNESFVPMNANYGIIDQIEKKMKKVLKRELYGEISKQSIKSYKEVIGWK